MYPHFNPCRGGGQGEQQRREAETTGQEEKRSDGSGWIILGVILIVIAVICYLYVRGAGGTAEERSRYNWPRGKRSDGKWLDHTWRSDTDCNCCDLLPLCTGLRGAKRRNPAQRTHVHWVRLCRDWFFQMNSPASECRIVAADLGYSLHPAEDLEKKGTITNTSRSITNMYLNITIFLLLIPISKKKCFVLFSLVI